MFFLFGLGKQTVKKLGKTREQVCERCHKPSQRVLVKVVDWFTLFFVPIFPYLTRYALICPLCDDAREVSRDEAGDLLKDLRPLDPSESGDSSVHEEPDGSADDWLPGTGLESKNNANRARPGKYEGKNATQIAYLARLEARDREMEAQREKEEQEAKTAGVKDSTVREIREKQESQNARVTKSDGTVQKSAGNADIREKTFAAREVALEAREKAATVREMALEAREKAVEVREKAAETREAIHGTTGEEREDTA